MNLTKLTNKIACVSLLAFMAGGGVVADDVMPPPGADLYFSVQDDALKFWDNKDGWVIQGGGSWTKRLPAENDTLTFNSKYLSLSGGYAPLQITNGVDAVCKTLRIATSNKGSGSSYADDGRIIGLRMTGGSLTLPSLENTFFVGDNAAGYGVFDMCGGTLTAYHSFVGVNGIGVMTNSGGKVILSTGPDRGDPWIVVGHNAGSQGTLVQTAGSIAFADVGTSAWNVRVIVGNRGSGLFELTGGVVSNKVYLGNDVGGHGTLDWRGGDIASLIHIGENTGATGIVNAVDVKISGDIAVGVRGDGTLNVSGNVKAENNKNIEIGSSPGGIGRLVWNATGDKLSMQGRTGTIYAGILGKADVTVSGCLAAQYVKIGGTNTVCSTMKVQEGGVVACEAQMNIGSYPVPNTLWGTAATVYTGGRAEMILQGGKLKFLNGSYSERNFFLGRYAADFPGTFGVLRGWGVVEPAASGGGEQNNIRMSIGDGQVIADGEGEEHLLDLNQVVNVASLTENAVDTTNGWYAVNKGCVHYPRTWFAQTSPITKYFGAYSYTDDRAPDFVNSVKFTMRGVKYNQNHFRGGLYASDRNDVHADALPPKSDVIGIWKFGLFSTVDGMDRVGFDDIDVTFHYDHTKVKATRSLALSRWNVDTGRWERLVNCAPTANNCITVTSLAPMNTDGYNVGLFALITREAGMVLLVR